MAANPRRERADPLRDTLSADRDGAGFSATPAGVQPGLEVIPAQQGFGDVITARRTEKPRSLPDVKRQLKEMAAAFGQTWVYSWEVNDRKRNRKVLVEGGTIKMANAISRIFGNCAVDVRVFDQGARWLFYARFVDLETGYQLTRSYQQRKMQDIGMSDDQRALDMVFQSGQSKALRNVILNALPDLAQYCLEEAKEGILKEIEGAPDKARAWIKRELEKLGVELSRVERVYTRTADKWTTRDMAKIYTELQSVADGFMSAADLYPTAEEEKAEAARQARQGGEEPAVVLASERKESGPAAGKSDAAIKGTDAPPPTTAAATSRDAGEAQQSAPAAKSPPAAGTALKILLVCDGKEVGTTTDTSLKGGDPITVGGIEYIVARRMEWLKEGEETPSPALMLTATAGSGPAPLPGAAAKSKKQLF